MTLLKSYLIRAVRDWALESGLTPYILVDADCPGVVVPVQFVNRGRIVLNVHPRAVNALVLDDSVLRFSARFAGQSLGVEIPTTALMAVYAKENGQGITFPQSERSGNDAGDSGAQDNESGATPSGKPHLTVVK
jgi:stringent starvation protein B